MGRILIVDDENNIRTMMRLGLQSAGHEVETAPDGSEALTKFGFGAGWDLVLLDQRMPGMDGLEVAREIRRRDAQARVIMITAYGTVDLTRDALRAGAMSLIRKPFTLDVLRGAVQSALNDAPIVPPDESDSPTPGVATFGLASINGFHIISDEANENAPQDAETPDSSGKHFDFTVRGPQGDTHRCTIVLPCFFVELIKAHADRDAMGEADPFWRWLCEESLANYLWQHAEPPADVLQVDELTTGLRRWMDAVLAK